MITLNSIDELQNYDSDKTVAITLYLADIKEQVTSTGSVYSRLYFRDVKGSISVPLWNMDLATAQTVYKIDTVYALVAVIGAYKDSMTIKRIVSSTEVTDSNIVKKYKQHMFKYATNTCCEMVALAVGSLKESKYYKYATAIYGTSIDSQQFSKCKKAYASINYHDNYPGGLINHVGGMLLIASQLKKIYLTGRCETQWDVSWQYITIGILMHDIGKLDTYSDVTEHTVRFRDTCLLDHNKIGVGILYAIHNSLPEEERLQEEDFQQLAYTICYHDDIEKLYTHKRIEDKIISYIDGLESTLAGACSLELV